MKVSSSVVKKYFKNILAVGVLGVMMAVALPVSILAQYSATTSVSLTVCGDGLVAPNEFCDDGTNTGAYASSIATRNCDPLCSAWGPYCGDSVVQVFYGEECDDGNNSAGDYCSADCQNETEPVIEGGGGSGGSGGGGGRSSGGSGIPGASTEGDVPFIGETEVRIYGKAYPNARITVLRDGELERVVEADSSANFSVTLTDQVPGITTLGFWALDRSSRRSVTYSATFQVVENAATTLSGVIIPPTLQVVPEKVPPNTPVSFEGSGLPSAEIAITVNNEKRADTTTVASNGDWKLTFDTTGLSAEAFHSAKVKYTGLESADLESGHSLMSSFYVGVRDVDTPITADLNVDGSVNLTDFSILLFHWNTASAVADINQDGIVSLADFSIMLFYWTG